MQVFWTCPHCGEEFEVTSAAAEIFCTLCGGLIEWELGSETSRIEQQRSASAPPISHTSQIHDQINIVTGSGNRIFEPSVALFAKATADFPANPELQMLKAIHHLAHHPQPLLSRALLYYHKPNTKKQYVIGTLKSLKQTSIDPYKNVPFNTYLQRLLRREDAFGNPDPSGFWGFATPFVAALQYMTPDREAACLHVLKMADSYVRICAQRPLPHERRKDKALVAGRSDIRAGVLFYNAARNETRLQAAEGLEDLNAMPFNAKQYFLPSLRKLMDQPNAKLYIDALEEGFVTPYWQMADIKKKPDV